MSRTIGILTSGGDAPGSNACIAAIAARAEMRGIRVRGILRGFEGLAQGATIPLGVEVLGLARRGGTFLGTSRNGDLKGALGADNAQDAMQRCGVDSLIVLGGGGSLKAAAEFAGAGARVVGIPCTIDNDIPGTDHSLGFDSAVNKAVRAADEIMDTAESLPERLFLLETLGGTTGHIAIATAYAADADAVFIHERQWDAAAAAAHIKRKMDAGGSQGLVVCCENLGADQIARDLAAASGRRVRITSLGHTQRGGNPTYFDRTLARAFADKAFEMILAEDWNKMVAHTGGAVDAVSFDAVSSTKKDIDAAKYAAVNES